MKQCLKKLLAPACATISMMKHEPSAFIKFIHVIVCVLKFCTLAHACVLRCYTSLGLWLILTPRLESP